MMTRRDYPDSGEALYSAVLPNGLQVLVCPRPGYAKGLAFFATKYGGAMRRFTLDGRAVDTPAGVAHFLEHKMFDLPEGNALAMLSQRGARANAFTSSGITAYHFDCTEGFFDDLGLLCRFVSTPYFTAESVQKEQGIIGQEIRMTEDSPDFALYYAFLRALYEHNPIRDSVAGTVESIAKITPETLYDCHRAFYAPSNMVLCAVGDLDPEAVAETALRILPAEKMPVPQPDFGPAEAAEPAAARAELFMDVSAPQFLIGGKLPCPQGREQLRQMLLCELALRCLVGRSSRLYTSLYGEGLLRADFSYGEESTCGTAYFELGGESAEPGRVLERFNAEVRRVSENGLDAAAFENARRADYGLSLRYLDSFRALARQLTDGAMNGYDYLDVFALSRSLTAEDCAQYIRENFAPERLALATVSPRGAKG